MSKRAKALIAVIFSLFLTLILVSILFSPPVVIAVTFGLWVVLMILVRLKPRAMG